MLHRFLVLPAVALTAISCTAPARANVTINTAFPGGNGIVDENKPGEVRFHPDLRGGSKWFYWYIEAQATQPGKVRFIMPSMSIGIGGPAFSRDGGASWQWLGADAVERIPAPEGKPRTAAEEAFSFTFAKPGEKVRFSVGIPYVQSNLDDFLKRHSGNPLLKKSELTKSKKGRPVELLEIGQHAPGKQYVLFTGRAHACEAMASYVVEGIAGEALSGSEAAKGFLSKYTLLVVPFVDKDGVEDGDQGKNRPPHDHNRDYGDAPIYPEVAAIQKLAADRQVRLAVDYHCPALRGDIHEAIHFLGLGMPHVKENLAEWISWIDEEKPQVAGTPVVALADASKPNALDRRINSHYFASSPGNMLGVTLEFPYNLPNVTLDPALARAYGAGLLKAWNRTVFLPQTGAEPRGNAGKEALVAWRKQFTNTYRRVPADGLALIKAVQEDPAATSAFKSEADLMLAVMLNFQKKYADVIPAADKVISGSGSTTVQRYQAMAQKARALANRAETTPAEMEAAMKAADAEPYMHSLQRTAVLVPAVDYYQARKDYAQAVAYTEKLVPTAPAYEKGKFLNRRAEIYTLAGQPDKALATRQEAVTLLRAQIGEKPQRSVFGAAMVTELFNAIEAIPSSTAAEKKAAAEMVLNHDIVLPAVKERVRKAVETLN